ncbi:MAG: ThuA domain-containing protein [Sphingomonas sp.]
MIFAATRTSLATILDKPAAMLALFCLALGAAVPASARPVIDCPLRNQPYSIDSPLVDVLLNPAARAAVDQSAPSLLKGLSDFFANTRVPTFSAIMSVRSAATMRRLPPDALGPVDRALHAVPRTAADKVARCARYDIAPQHLAIPAGKPRLLLFEKMTGFRDDPSVAAAHAIFVDMAKRNGWALVVTDKGGAITPANLRHFDAVIWNNVSGDVLTVRQRAAFKAYMEHGGGFVGVHGSGGDPVYFWDWYTDTLLGARFIGHPMAPQFQDARIAIETTRTGIGQDLAPGWTMKDEWYSFRVSPRLNAATVIATLDEASYSPGALHMGDHPIAWTRCVGNGRSFYSAIGHMPATYSEPHYVRLLEQAVGWAAGKGKTRCRAGKQIEQPGRG